MFKKCLNIHYIYDKTNARDGRKRVLEQAGAAEHRNITEAAPNGLKLGEGGQSDESWPSGRRWRRGVFVMFECS